MAVTGFWPIKSNLKAALDYADNPDKTTPREYLDDDLYIRLTHLIPELLEKMDAGEIALSVGVELSYLDEQSQYDVLEICETNDCSAIRWCVLS